MSSRFIHVVTNDRISFLLWLNNIPSCIYTTFSYSFVSRHLGCRLLPYCGYCKYCYNEHRSPISLWDPDFNSFGCIPTTGIARSYVNSIFIYLYKSPWCFPQWLIQFTFSSTVYKGCFFSIPSPTLITCFFSFLINFYWSIDALECCVSFYCRAKWISHTYTYIPSLLDFPPI